jgi:hypothetical protein
MTWCLSDKASAPARVSWKERICETLMRSSIQTLLQTLPNLDRSPTSLPWLSGCSAVFLLTYPFFTPSSPRRYSFCPRTRIHMSNHHQREVGLIGAHCIRSCLGVLDVVFDSLLLLVVLGGSPWFFVHGRRSEVRRASRFTTGGPFLVRPTVTRHSRRYTLACSKMRAE